MGNLKGVPTVAFCGLGNPYSFWRSLENLGVEPLGRYDYGDHHSYTPSEIRRLAQHARDVGAEVLVTTAKDAINLDAGYREIVAPLRLVFLEIGIDIEAKQGLVERITGLVPLASRPK